MDGAAPMMELFRGQRGYASQCARGAARGSDRSQPRGLNRRMASSVEISPSDGIDTPERVDIVHSFPKEYFETPRRWGKVLTIVVEEHELKAHMELLKARVPFFHGLLTSIMMEATTGAVHLRDLSTTDSLLDYVYTGNLTISETNVQNLMVGAIFLQIESVIDECAKFMTRRIRIDNAIDLLRISMQTANDNMRKDVLRFLDKNFLTISVTDRFLHLTSDEFVLILQRDSLQVKNEEQVFRALNRWMEVNLFSDDTAARLLACIRCTCLSDAFLTDIAEKSRWVKESRECIHLLDEATRFIKNKINGTCTFKTTERVCEERQIVFLEAESLSISCDESIAMLIHIYDPIENEWTSRETQMFPYSKGTETVVENKAYFIVCLTFDVDSPDPRHICHVFDVQSGQRHLQCNARDDHQQLELSMEECKCYRTISNIFKYAAGGFILNGDAQEALSTVETYNTSDEQPEWLPSKPMKKIRQGSATCVLDGKFYVIGGYDYPEYWNNSETLDWNDGECYDPETDCWTLIAPMNKTRTYFDVASLNGFIYAVGGFVNEHGGRNYDVPLSDVERYDPDSDTWLTLNCMPLEGYVRLFVLCSKLFAVVRESVMDEWQYFSYEEMVSVVMYEPESDTWEIRCIEHPLQSRITYGRSMYVFGLPVSATISSFMADLEVEDNIIY